MPVIPIVVTAKLAMIPVTHVVMDVVPAAITVGVVIVMIQCIVTMCPNLVMRIAGFVLDMPAIRIVATAKLATRPAITIVIPTIMAIAVVEAALVG